MRIRVYYHESVDQLPGDKSDLVTERLVPQAVVYWESILNVVNPVNDIKLNRDSSVLNLI